MRKPMGEREFYRQMEQRQEKIFDVVRELHIAGFSMIYIESMAVGREDYWCRIFINDKEISVDRLQPLIDLVDALEGVHLFLDNNRELGIRLGVWVNR